MRAWNSTLKPGKGLQRKAPMRQSRAPMKSRGMKGKPATVPQRNFHSLLADVVGCIACRQEGGYTDLVSIHHIDGRTKPDAHWLVLPLCGPHHQDMGIDGAIPVHPHKARFEAAYGKQEELLKKSIQILLDGGFIVPYRALAVAGMEEKCPASVAADPGVAHVIKEYEHE